MILLNFEAVLKQDCVGPLPLAFEVDEPMYDLLYILGDFKTLKHVTCPNQTSSTPALAQMCVKFKLMLWVQDSECCCPLHWSIVL